MLNYALYMQTSVLLSKSTALTAKLSLASGSFYEACLKYFNVLQSFADEHNLYFSTDIATAIEKLTVYNGEPRISDKIVTVRRNPRKEKDAFAVTWLESVRKDIKTFLEKDRKTYDECGDIWRQVVSRLLCKTPELASLPSGRRLDYILNAVASDTKLLPYYSHVTGLLGVFNAKALLDTILPNLGL